MNKEGKKHVLIIDDNEDILTMLQVMLQHNGYKVSVLNKFQELLQIVTHVQPDVILMDKFLSGSDGCEFCKKIKGQSELVTIPVIMISAHPEAKTECLEAGANFFIEKPFEMNDLLQTIKTALITA